MSGFRDKNLRSGDIHEEFGLLLLKAIGLVAPVPRTEDVGADAFVTLLRPESSRQLVAEDSFLIQLKARSVKTVPYDTQESLNWLRNIEVPFFVGSVDIGNTSLSLYPTHHLFPLRLEQPPWLELIHLHIIPPARTQTRRAIRRVDLGPPALTWSAKDLKSANFFLQAYEVLKAHVRIQQRNIQLTTLGQYELVNWATGNIPSTQGKMILDPSYTNALEAMVPPISVIMTSLIHKKRYEDLDIILRFMDYRRQKGVEPDPGGYLTSLALHLADGAREDRCGGG